MVAYFIKGVKARRKQGQTLIYIYKDYHNWPTRVLSKRGILDGIMIFSRPETIREKEEIKESYRNISYIYDDFEKVILDDRDDGFTWDYSTVLELSKKYDLHIGNLINLEMPKSIELEETGCLFD
jgi:hypothetical protein